MLNEMYSGEKDNKMADSSVQDELIRLRLKLLEQVSIAFSNSNLRIRLSAFNIFSRSSEN